jgi:hypothetical protein
MSATESPSQRERRLACRLCDGTGWRPGRMAVIECTHDTANVTFVPTPTYAVWLHLRWLRHMSDFPCSPWQFDIHRVSFGA